MATKVLRKKDDVVKPIPAKKVWSNHHNNRIEEQCMTPFIAEDAPYWGK